MSPRSEDPDAFLSLKIPPPAWFLGSAGLIYLASRGGPKPAWRWSGLPLVGLGLGLGVHALSAFKRHQTTASPFHPEKTEQLVSQGAYRFTRNPMYLGLALVLSGWSLIRASLSGFLVVPAFVWTLTKVQIIPEEKRLQRLFGDEYSAYQAGVRRWLGTRECSVCALVQKVKSR